MSEGLWTVNQGVNFDIFLEKRMQHHGIDIEKKNMEQKMELAPRYSRSVEHRRKSSGSVTWSFRSMVSILRDWWRARELMSEANEGILMM